MALVTCTPHDFSHLLFDDRLSDVTLILVEEVPGGSAAGSCEEVPAHGLILLASSGYCKAKIENWSSAASSSDAKRRIVMPLPLGQLLLGRALVQGMYCRQLDLSSLSQQQQLQLLLLADRYDVPRVLGAAATALQSVPTGQLDWQVVAAMFQLPASCQTSAACSGMLLAAATELQRRLGDLEAAHNDASGTRQQQLAGLPFAALKQLLQDPTTRANSENTVVYTILQWHQAACQQQQQQPNSAGDQQQQQQQPNSAGDQQQQQQQPNSAGDQQQQQQWQAQLAELLCLTRMRHCSQLFVATVLTGSALAGCLSPQELGLAVAVAGAGVLGGGSNIACEAVGSLGSPAFRSVWTAARRPASAVLQSFDWRLPLRELAQLVGGHCSDSKLQPTALTCPTKPVWQGHALALLAECRGGGESVAGKPGAIMLGLRLRPVQLPPGAVCRLTYSVEVVKHDLLWPGVDSTQPAVTQMYADGCDPGCAATLDLGASDSSWAAELKRQRLVHNCHGGSVADEAALRAHGWPLVRVKVTDIQ